MAEHRNVVDAQHLRLPDAAATLRLGDALAAGARNGLVLHLRGELGAGKTTLVRGFLRALGFAGHVKSPSYSLVEPYGLSRLNLYHFDFYRFQNRSEWWDSGFREYFNSDALCVVEWPERAAGAIADPDLEIELSYSGTERQAALSARSPQGKSWLEVALPRSRGP